MTEQVKARNTRVTIMRLWGYLRRQRMALAAVAVLVTLATVAGVLVPYLLGRAIDDYIIPGDLRGLTRIALLMLALYIVQSVLTWASGWLMVKVGQQTVLDLRNDLFTRLQSLPLRFFDQRPHGETMSRLTNDVENVNTVLSESLVQIISGTLTAIGVIVLMMILQPELALVAVGSTLILTVGINRYIGMRTREGFRAQQKHLGSLNGLIEETITGQRVVKAYHREARVIEEFDAGNAELRQAATRAQTFAGFVGPLMNFVGNLSLALVAGVGGWLVLNGTSTVGTVAAFINYTRQLGRPINEIANLYNQLQSAIAGAERVFEVLDEAPEVDAAGGPRVDLQGDVVFEDVSFSYDGVTPVLRNVSAHASPGQLVALVGPTGAGKTTIINLLTRFYEIDEGRVLLDGHEIRTLEKSDLRRQLGVVLQDTFLFAGTVRDNIRYGKLDATDDEIEEAARLANADGFIRRLPHGYDSELTERGGNLSQGQRQLLAIARAALSDPTILILDEATSSVDTRTERHIQGALLRLMKGRTSFVIAHRLSTIRSADQILVINQGEIVERGTHRELLEEGGFYARLHNSQFRGDAELARQEERAQIEEAAVLAIARETD
ncbi:MAG: ABC transporter ATP-binding protein [Chloroflexi bacterium]|nr:ABC transporter ATP-binding protein [Chloroflexota bacterium]